MKSSFESFAIILKQLRYVLDSRQRKGAFVVLLCMIMSSSMELLGVSAIYPFLQMALKADEMQTRWYVRCIKSVNTDISGRSVLIIMGIAIMLIYIIKNLFLLLSAYVQNRYATNMQKENTIKVLDAYLKRSYEFFLNTNSSIILRGIGNDVSGVYQILLCCFTLIAEMLNVVLLGVFLFVTDPFITVSAMILAGASFWAIVFGFKGKMKRAGQNMRQAGVLKSKYSYQAVMGIKEITVLDRRNQFIDQFKEAAELEAKTSLTNGFLTACPDRILEGVCIAGFMGIVCIEIAMGKDLNTFIPVLGTFAMGAFRILPSISKLSSRINQIVFYRPCLQSTYDNLKEISQYEEENAGAFEERKTYIKERISFQNCLEIKNISWKYLNAQNNVLQGLSLTIHKGESVAFIGASGAGKTTLADVIMGLLPPQAGSVEMDGIDIFSIPHQWSRVIGYVPQSVFLIDDTVRSNVAFGLKKEDVSDDKIWAALGEAQLKEFVEGLPHGLDTIVGERGVKFSGGQRQRIAIARALYENPDILVLDEATAALDTETENAVMESIDALQGSKTLIIVAHRLTTIRNCDKIYEIKDGVAVERRKEEVLGER